MLSSQRKLHFKRKSIVVMMSICAVVLGSCGGGRSELGTGPAPCFQILPIAQSSVSQPSTFLGVKMIKTALAENLLSSTFSIKSPSVCLAAYSLHGNGTATLTPKRKFLLVAVSVSNRKVLATRQVSRLPLNFKHPY